MNPGPPDHLPPCFLNLNWDQAMETGGHLDSALGSIVPSSQSSNSPVAADSLAFHKLIGGLQNIANSVDEISPHSHYAGPQLNSPPRLNLSAMGGGSHLHQQSPAMGGLPALARQQLLRTHLDQFAADPGFAERTTRFSSFDGRNFGQLPGQFVFPDSGKLPRATSGLGIGPPPEGNKEMLVQGGLPPEMTSGESGNAREESSVSDPAAASAEVGRAAPVGSSSKKRKAPQKGKGKDTATNPAINLSKAGDEGELDAKRSRSMEDPKPDDAKPKAEQNDGVSTSANGSQNKNKEANAKPPEPPKDYIHVRARRGQATDSHSLAERLRREKISQRMKLLQDLVPGCNKVTGKAVMLDEIINYVQSLQRQVEFLSMKLATVNPRLDFNNLANLLPKDMNQSCGPMQSAVYPVDASGMTSSYAGQTQRGNSLHCVLNNGMESQNSMHLLDSAFHQNLSASQPFLDGLENASSQLGAFWEDDFQSVVQVDLGQNQNVVASSPSFHGSLPTAHMKIDL